MNEEKLKQLLISRMFFSELEKIKKFFKVVEETDYSGSDYITKYYYHIYLPDGRIWTVYGCADTYQVFFE